MNEQDVQKELEAGDRVWEVWGLWRTGLSLSVNGYLNMGKAIHIWKQEKLWRYDIKGTSILTFNGWVKSVLHISPAQAHRLEQVYREAGDVLMGMSTPVDISKVTLLLPHLADKTPEEKRVMLEDAAECTVEDIKNNLKDMAGNSEKATDVCQHEDTELISRCRLCGKWLK